MGNGRPFLNPCTVPDVGYFRGMRLILLYHLVLGGTEIVAKRYLFKSVFGFSVSEELISHEDETRLAIFLTGSNKPHDIAFVLQPVASRFHHVSFLLESVNDLFHAGDLIGMYDIPVADRKRVG